MFEITHGPEGSVVKVVVVWWGDSIIHRSDAFAPSCHETGGEAVEAAPDQTITEQSDPIPGLEAENEQETQQNTSAQTIIPNPLTCYNPRCPWEEEEDSPFPFKD